MRDKDQEQEDWEHLRLTLGVEAADEDADNEDDHD